LKTDEGF